MKRRCALLFLAIFAFFLSTNMTAKNIVFDMGGVLFKRSTWSVLWHLKGSVVGYLCLEWGSEKTLKLKFFECMARNIPYPKNIKPAPITEFGQPIPYPLYEHFLGSRDSLDILKDVKAAIDKDSTISKENPSPFLSPRESYLLKKSAEIIFDPKIFIKTNKAISDGINIFKDCYYQGHNVYIISCWGDQAFDLLESQYPDIFGRCKGHIISAKVHLVKPDPKIYHKLLDDFHLDPTETFFIDDRIENDPSKLHDKRLEKITFIYCDDHRRVRSELQERGILVS